MRTENQTVTPKTRSRRWLGLVCAVALGVALSLASAGPAHAGGGQWGGPKVMGAAPAHVLDVAPSR